MLNCEQAPKILIVVCGSAGAAGDERPLKGVADGKLRRTLTRAWSSPKLSSVKIEAPMLLRYGPVTELADTQTAQPRRRDRQRICCPECSATV